jgi:hypothetical protein
MDPTALQTAVAKTPLDALNLWAPIVWLKTNAYAYPALEVVHIVGLALVFGSIVLVDLRVLGVLKLAEANHFAKAVIPWTLLGFVLALITGLTMFVTRISDFIANIAFIIKMCLLFAAGANAAVLHARGTINLASRLTKLQALLSIVIWIAIIFCGRWIAYV